MKTFTVCGNNNFNQISETSNFNRNFIDTVYPPIKPNFNASAILSYSMHFSKSIIITDDGLIHAIGLFGEKRRDISAPVSTTYDHFTLIDIKDDEGRSCSAISAIGGSLYSLYLISKRDENNIYHLAYSHADIDSPSPIIFNTNGYSPIAIFGGKFDCAAIDSEGAIIYIHSSFCESPNKTIESIYLPDSELATSIAWSTHFVIALSANGRVFLSMIGNILSFNEVSELKGIEIICISGLCDHCFAVSKDGKVFGRGTNLYGQLGLGKNVKKVTEFIEIASLSKYKIVAAYAGYYHSIFQTDNGKLFACGSNFYGNLMISSGPSDTCVIYEPVLTTITDASFCIAGDGTTAVFKNYIPPMNPNKRVDIERFNLNSSTNRSSKTSAQEENKDLLAKQKEEYEGKLAEKDIENEEKLTKQKEKFEAKLKDKDNELANQKEEYEEKLAKKDIENEEKLIKQKEEYEKKLESNKKQLESINSQLGQEAKILINEKNFKQETTKIPKIKLLDKETINSFEKLEKISSGNFGKVYKVAKNVLYALKILKKKVSHEEFRYFLAEYEIMNLLEHPNILKTFGIFLSDDSQPPSILLEFCPLSLEEAIKNKKLTKVEIVFIIYQIIEGMKYIHFMKIIHRDLKPTNILIGLDDLIKISDFGISKLMTAEEQSKTFGIGTQKFMAPEIIDEINDYDEKVDVYSFGVLMFFIVSGGEMPAIKMSDKMRGKKAEISSSFTDFARELINKCWSFDSNDRPSFSEMLDEIEKRDYGFMELTISELNKVKSLIKKHKEIIPSY